VSAELAPLQPEAIPGEISATALVLDRSLSFEQWEAVGRTFDNIGGGLLWWIGDWLNYGEKNYGETYSQALDFTNYEYQTLMDARWVAGKVEISRRRENLPWSHHKEIAALPPAEQDEWLDEAEPDTPDGKPKLSRNSLRRAIKEKKKCEENLEKIAALPADRCRLIRCDLKDADQEIGANSVDVIITDPPYPKDYVPLYEDLAKLAAHALKPGGSMLVMIGQSYLPEILSLMTPHIGYHWIVSYLTPGGQSAQLWQRKVNTFWKPVLWFVKGEYAGEWVGDVAKSEVNDNDKRFHEWGQSESGMADLIDRFSRPGDLILDPFLGGGTTGVVALKMDRQFVGIDVDERAVETARERMAADELG
jgi:DNA methylase